MRRAWPTSLTLRLGLWFFAAAVLTFAAVGSYLDRALAAELKAREDRDLLEKVAYIRHLLEEVPSVPSIRSDTHRFVDAAAGHAGMLLQLKAEDGTLLMQNAEAFAHLPALRPAASDRDPEPASVQTWRLPSGAYSRVVSAWAPVGRDAGQRVLVIIARSTAATDSLLASYRTTVYVAVLTGALLAGLLGYLLTRRGLTPIRLVAGHAHTITAQRLDTRLDVASAPAELQVLVRAFNAMLDRLHDSFLRLSQFSADLAHDLRTPINNLMVQSQVALGQSRSAEEYQGLLASNVEEYERLARMIDGMLFLARADHAHVALHRETLDVRGQLQRIAEYFEGIAEEAGVALTVEGEGQVNGDATLFQRAVNNLVANAVRHARPGTAVLLKVARETRMVCVSVTNVGPEIDPAHVPRLFDRFYRVETARTDSASSAGLGLAIVHSIMRLHEGHVDVDSASGRTTFYLRFPALPEACQPRYNQVGRTC